MRGKRLVYWDPKRQLHSGAKRRSGSGAAGAQSSYPAGRDLTSVHTATRRAAVFRVQEHVPRLRSKPSLLSNKPGAERAERAEECALAGAMQCTYGGARVAAEVPINNTLSF